MARPISFIQHQRIELVIDKSTLANSIDLSEKLSDRSIAILFPGSIVQHLPAFHGSRKTVAVLRACAIRTASTSASYRLGMLLTKYGLREWLTITIFCSLGAASAIVFLNWYWLAIIIALIWLALVSFFRDPLRRIKTNLAPGTMLSPADGVISAVEYVDDHASTNGPAVIIRIFLSVLNVHVNRAPFSGTVVDITYKPGEFLNAQTEESARVNESNLITLRIHWDDDTAPSHTDTESGAIRGTETIGIRQVSGMIARRIVCPLQPGDQLVRGKKFGMIKFGSTTELILPRPDDVTVLVGKGDKARAGLTVLARLEPLEIEAMS